VDLAAELISCGAADLHVGRIPSSAEFLQEGHPNSRLEQSIRQRAERDAMIRNYFISRSQQ
jgi:hypothetical protein